MTLIRFTAHGRTIETDVPATSPLGWRWWRKSWIDQGWQDERCLPLGHVDLPDGRTALLIALEQDGLMMLTTPFMIFPILDDAKALDGAAAFAASVIQRTAVAPMLL